MSRKKVCGFEFPGWLTKITNSLSDETLNRGPVSTVLYTEHVKRKKKNVEEKEFVFSQKSFKMPFCRNCAQVVMISRKEKNVFLKKHCQGQQPTSQEVISDLRIFITFMKSKSGMMME